MMNISLYMPMEMMGVYIGRRRWKSGGKKLKRAAISRLSRKEKIGGASKRENILRRE